MMRTSVLKHQHPDRFFITCFFSLVPQFTPLCRLGGAQRCANQRFILERQEKICFILIHLMKNSAQLSRK